MCACTESQLSAPYELRRYGDGVLPEVVDISRLHAELLPRSPIALLGRRFRERFYYKELPELGLIFGAVAYVGGQAVGFSAATPDPDHFLLAAVRRRWPLLGWVVGTSLVQDPRRLAAVWEAMRIQFHRTRSAAAQPAGELLSFGVLPEYRSPTGLRIARDLVLGTIEAFQAKGIDRVFAIVDVDNLPSLRFLQKLGFRPRRAEVPGWRHASTELVWEKSADSCGGD